MYSSGRTNIDAHGTKERVPWQHLTDTCIYSSGRTNMVVRGMNLHARGQQKVDICKYCNMRGKNLVHGTSIHARGQQKVDICTYWSGRAKMVVRGTNQCASMQQKNMDISTYSCGCLLLASEWYVSFVRPINHYPSKVGVKPDAFGVDFLFLRPLYSTVLK
jgi:hypothetical protein